MQYGVFFARHRRGVGAEGVVLEGRGTDSLTSQDTDRSRWIGGREFCGWVVSLRKKKEGEVL